CPTQTRGTSVIQFLGPVGSFPIEKPNSLYLFLISSSPPQKIINILFIKSICLTSIHNRLIFYFQKILVSSFKTIKIHRFIVVDIKTCFFLVPAVATDEIGQIE